LLVVSFCCQNILECFLRSIHVDQRSKYEGICTCRRHYLINGNYTTLDMVYVFQSRSNNNKIHLSIKYIHVNLFLIQQWTHSNVRKKLIIHILQFLLKVLQNAYNSLTLSLTNFHHLFFLCVTLFMLFNSELYMLQKGNHYFIIIYFYMVHHA
jgi:hypothetical protein